MILPADEESIERAARALARGELVAFPTETVYGLGARADDDDAVARIYEAKGRPAENPSIVHAADVEAALSLSRSVSGRARALAGRFWPGPLTLVLPVDAAKICARATAGGPTVALRVPAHPVAAALLRHARLPVAAPSANRSMFVSPTTAAHVEKSFPPSLLILDGGPTGFGIESTIVDVTREPAHLLRRGSIGIDALREILDVVDVGGRTEEPDRPMRAPGAMKKHYAPRAPLSLSSRAAIAASSGRQTGFIVRGLGAPVPRDAAAVEVLPDEPEGYARALYAALHRLDDAGVAAIVVEAPPAHEAWAAVADRLARASAKP